MIINDLIIVKSMLVSMLKLLPHFWFATLKFAKRFLANLDDSYGRLRVNYCYFTILYVSCCIPQSETAHELKCNSEWLY